MAQRPDPYERPAGAGDDTVAATGKLSEALEWVERARGRLFDFHQMIGHADFMLEEAADALQEAGHVELAERIRTEAVGRNVLPGRWTFQVVDEFDDHYYGVLRGLEALARDQLLEGRRHVFESELKDSRRTAGMAGHERRPDEEDAAPAARASAS